MAIQLKGRRGLISKPRPKLSSANNTTGNNTDNTTDNNTNKDAVGVVEK